VASASFGAVADAYVVRGLEFDEHRARRVILDNRNPSVALSLHTEHPPPVD